MNKLLITVMRSQVGGKPIRIKAECKVLEQDGDDPTIDALLLDVEMAANMGSARIHISVLE